MLTNSTLQLGNEVLYIILFNTTVHFCNQLAWVELADNWWKQLCWQKLRSGHFYYENQTTLDKLL